MTEYCRRMLNDDECDSPEKCRERRRRRIEMRQVTALSAGQETKRLRAEEANTSSSAPDEVGEQSEAAREPVFGIMSVAGRSRHMEDAVSVWTSLCLPEICRRRPVHFFAVYDGHGGPHVAELCREKMHVIVQEELVRLSCTRGVDASGEVSGGSKEEDEDVVEEEEGLWRRAMERSFQRMDEVAMNTCACGSAGYQCGCQPTEVALGGSTAVVVVLTPDHIVVANCGDSRAVLSRGGRAVPLSHDHKPDRSDELERIEAAGGRVIFVDGARVEGILAMSRAIERASMERIVFSMNVYASARHYRNTCVVTQIHRIDFTVGPVGWAYKSGGDKYLKPFVISHPEITFSKREPEDECLIIASDGLWDVLSSELACDVARECLREGSTSATSAIDPSTIGGPPQVEEERSGALYPSRSTLAAALLTRLALGRKSSDNVSVIVVDLKRS